MSRYERDEREEESNGAHGGYGAIIGLVAAGFGVLAAGLALQTQKERNYDNEAQREHERDMAEQSRTNPQISVRTGRIDVVHHHEGETSQFTPAALKSLETHGIQAIKNQFD